MTIKKKESSWTDAKFIRPSRMACKLLGMCGRMLYHSKSMKQPTTIFNANIFNVRAKKIWFGDIEIERDREGLLKISRRLGPLYVLEEMDGRFLEFLPTIGYIKSRAAVVIENGTISYSKDFSEYVEMLCKRMKKSSSLMRNNRGRNDGKKEK